MSFRCFPKQPSFTYKYFTNFVSRLLFGGNSYVDDGSRVDGIKETLGTSSVERQTRVEKSCRTVSPQEEKEKRKTKKMKEGQCKERPGVDGLEEEDGKDRNKWRQLVAEDWPSAT